MRITYYQKDENSDAEVMTVREAKKMLKDRPKEISNLQMKIQLFFT